MPRARGGNKRQESRKKILSLAKGFKGKRGTSHRIAKQAVMKALKNSYIGRRLKKRNFRSLWITRIGAAAKQNGLSYSALLGGLEKRGVAINRKMLADIAARDPGTFAEVAKLAKEAKERIEKAAKAKKDEVAPALALRAAGAANELRGTLKRWFEFYNGFQPEFSWWVKTPYGEAGKALEEYAKFLREEIAGQKGKDEDPLVGEPVGAEALAEAIRFEWLPYSTEELIAIGERELAWCEGEMRKAARAMGCGDDWKAALAKVKADFVPPGEQDELVARTAREAIEFTKKHRFATVPALCEETWRLTMMSTEKLKTIPYAAYSGQNMMVAYANAEMKQDDKLMVMRGNNRAFTHLTVFHELIPGHHLQHFQTARHNQHRHGFGTPFYGEGWALYCELRFWDLGWARTPQERIGMLFWRMTRAARIIVTLKFHLGRMKPGEMVNFFVERVGHERLGATSEIRRFIGHAPPLYQAGYLLGGLQLRTLHDELNLPDQQFHDAVLSHGPIPIELLRDELRQLPVTRDAKPSWRFADPK